MRIRYANNNDIEQIQKLIFNTINTINSKDYSSRQIHIWTIRANNINWAEKMTDQFFFVAETDHVITGFSSLSNSGHIDFLYVHKDYQRSGIASNLLKEILSIAKKK